MCLAGVIRCRGSPKPPDRLKRDTTSPVQVATDDETDLHLRPPPHTPTHLAHTGPTAERLHSFAEVQPVLQAPTEETTGSHCSRGISLVGTMADSGEGRVGRFHLKCSPRVVLSEDRRVARGKDYLFSSYVFSNDPIPIGLQFSVKTLQKDSPYVVSPLSASSRPHPSAAPYTAGGDVHVVHCCLFFVYCDGVEGA